MPPPGRPVRVEEATNQTHRVFFFMSLEELGWSVFFAEQLNHYQKQDLRPARVVSVQRSGLSLNDGTGEITSKLGSKWFQESVKTHPVIGDWVLVAKKGQVTELLKRKNVLERIAPNTNGKVQSIVANLDLLFIVSSCNDEFNESRLERFLTLASSADIESVILLTKPDLTEDGDSYRRRAQKLTNEHVELINATSFNGSRDLFKYLKVGKTLALIGSSGVGKSTILNTLSQQQIQKTRPIRETDSKGMHTTTSRSLHIIQDRGIIIDSPGVREIALVDDHINLKSSFEDIKNLAFDCKFSDCRHDKEPDCAIQRAIKRGGLDSRRLENFRRLSHRKLKP